MILQIVAFFGVFTLCWIAAALLVFGVRETRTRRVVGWILPLLGLCAMAIFASSMLSWQRLLVSSAGLLFLLKATILLQKPRAEVIEYSKFGLLLYGTLWPGMNPQAFRNRVLVPAAQLKAGEARFMRGFILMVCGLICAVATAVFAPQLGRNLVGWLGIVAFLLTLHFGISEILTFALRAFGWNVAPLFNEPWRSRSLRDFWSRRWNLAFVEMDTLLFFKPLRRRFGAFGAVFGIFVISGLLHETALSFPALGGWGGPLTYFLLHGLLVVLETKVLRLEKTWPVFAARIWTYFWVLLPLPWLFHAPFRESLIVPFYEWLHQILTFHTIDWWFSLALWLASLGHFCILGASFQVPSRLKWKEDLAQLTPFNRKIMWTYGGVIVLLIVSFGVLTFVLHAELMRGDRAALALAALIGTFWLVRIGVDLFYFNHEDWPEGAEFVAGHMMLTSLFIALTSVYFGLIIWHNFFR